MMNTPAPQQHMEPHPDDRAVNRFAVAMRANFVEKRIQGYGSWDRPDECTIEHLSRLPLFVGAGNPRRLQAYFLAIRPRSRMVFTVEFSILGQVILREADSPLAEFRDELNRILLHCFRPRGGGRSQTLGGTALSHYHRKNKTAPHRDGCRVNTTAGFLRSCPPPRMMEWPEASTHPGHPHTAGPLPSERSGISRQVEDGGCRPAYAPPPGSHLECNLQLLNEIDCTASDSGESQDKQDRADGPCDHIRLVDEVEEAPSPVGHAAPLSASIHNAVANGAVELSQSSFRTASPAPQTREAA